LGQFQQSEDVTATLVGEKTETFTRTILAPTNAHMVELSESQSMDRKASSADEAWDFVERIVAGRSSNLDVEHADAVMSRRTHQADDTSRDRNGAHVPIMRGPAHHENGKSLFSDA
jgi:hypothetical protein